MALKSIANFANFDALDIRVGKIIKAETAATQKPTYRLTIDFGPELGTRISCGAYMSYAQEALIGKQIIAVMNLGEKKMGPEVSQVLVLGVPNEVGETIYLAPQVDVGLGVSVF
ncbi:MAG TPA: hypothetical protein VFT64_06505 [Rickettsiales bacterium]|nr:hypothetical protein [Rickettsiales bacterium]